MTAQLECGELLAVLERIAVDLRTRRHGQVSDARWQMRQHARRDTFGQRQVNDLELGSRGKRGEVDDAPFDLDPELLEHGELAEKRQVQCRRRIGPKEPQRELWPDLEAPITEQLHECRVEAWPRGQLDLDPLELGELAAEALDVCGDWRTLGIERPELIRGKDSHQRERTSVHSGQAQARGECPQPTPWIVRLAKPVAAQRPRARRARRQQQRGRTRDR